MEIRASDLRKGRKIYFDTRFKNTLERYFLRWGKVMQRYEIVWEGSKHSSWFSDSLFVMVNKMNAMSQQHNIAIDDSKEWLNTTGDVVDWKKKVKGIFKTKK